MAVIQVENDSSFAGHLLYGGLVVVDFSASWCGPCQRIAPVYERLATEYSSRGVKFLKLDVDQCPETARANSVTGLPTFVFFKNQAAIDRIQGADSSRLESKLRELANIHAQSGDAGNPAGYIELNWCIDKKESECLNESDDHTLANALTPGSSTYLESDCDEQLIINLAFSQPVKIHSLKISAPAANGPQTVKLFFNHPRTLSFDQVSSMEPVQTIEFTEEDLTKPNLIPLRFVKFQNVQNLIMFVESNQSGVEVTTRIDHISLIGQAVSSTNMSALKRVSGKKGEGHF